MANYQSTHTGAEIDAGIDLLDNNSATSGQVLTANGSGGASWQNASGGGGIQLYKHSISVYGGAWQNANVLVFIDNVSTPYTSVNCPIKSASIASGAVGFDGENLVNGYKITYYFGENDVPFIYTTTKNSATFTLSNTPASFNDNVKPL